MYLSKEPLDLTVIYYTANYIDEKAPEFCYNTRHQLKKAIGEYELISVSQKPIDFGQNILFPDQKRSHYNIYLQILTGCKVARSEFVAMAEDDIMYSYDHFHTYVPTKCDFAYDMQKLSLFTWTKPAMYSFRTKRKVINHLIARRTALIDALEERFARRDEILKSGKDDEWIMHYWGDIGRYEQTLGVTVRETEEFYCGTPSIVYTHPTAYGYEFNHGRRKRLGDVKMYDIPVWGRAEDMVKLYYEQL